MKKITKAIIPAAGFGTRFLPASKSVPKEMMPIVDKPIIQYVVEDLVSAGIRDIIIVTSRDKTAIEDYFNNFPALENQLKETGKLEQLKELEQIKNLANFIFIRQKGNYGNGTPVLCAKHLIGDEPFIVTWGDDFFLSKVSRATQLTETFQRFNDPVLCCLKIDDPQDGARYGFFKGKEVESDVLLVDEIIEKPGANKAPSNWASVSGYVLTPDIFPILEKLEPGHSDEIWLVDALCELMKKRKIYAREIDGKYCDPSNKLSFIKANIEVGLQDKEIGKDLKEYLREL